MKRRVSLFLILALLITATAVALPAASTTATTAVFGDVDNNQKVDSTDARLVLQYAVQKIPATSLNLAVADVSGDGTVNSTDARLILQYAVKKIAAFPKGDTPTQGDLVTEVETVDLNTYTPGSFSPNGMVAGKPFATLSDVEKKIPASIDPDTKQFGYFAFTTELNPGLPFNVACAMGDNVLTAVLPAGVDLTALIPTFVFYGQRVTYQQTTVQSDTTALDCSAPVVLTMVAQDGSKKEIAVIVETLNTGLPSMAVTLENYAGASNIKKEEYTKATFYLGGGDGAVCDYAPDTSVLVAGTIKGRGNSSWKLDEKKSYTVKLDKKTALLDMAASKNWALVANYEDKTLLRNMMGYYFATEAGVPVVMQVRPVDMWIDGAYWGTYNLTEKIEIEPDRVNITDVEKPTHKDFVDLAADQVGYLIEFDAHVVEANAGGVLEDVQVLDPERWADYGWSRYTYNYYDYAANSTKSGHVYYNPTTDETFFRLPFMNKWATVKKPSTENLEHNPAMREYIFQQVMALDSALQVRNHKEIYNRLDLDSFAQWTLVQEMMDNTDSSFHSSVYMYLDVGGKFTFGPAWDFDRSSGNCEYWQHNVGSLLSTPWCSAAFNTDYGRVALELAWREFASNTADWRTTLAAYQTLIAKSAALNFERWAILDKQILYNPPSLMQSIAPFYEWEMYVAHLQGWLSNRMRSMESFQDVLFG